MALKPKGGWVGRSCVRKRPERLSLRYAGWTRRLASALNARNVTASAIGGNTTLTGSSHIDTINGGTGNDTITGGAGADTLSGGAGDDAFIITSLTDYAVGETIDGGTHTAHHSQIFGAENQGHEVQLFETDSVLAGNSPAGFDAPRQDLVAGSHHAVDGLLAGAAYFAVASTVAVRRVLRHPDYAYATG